MNLEIAIERKRKQMIELGLLKGFTDELVVLISQELDQLLNEYAKLR